VDGVLGVEAGNVRLVGDLVNGGEEAAAGLKANIGPVFSF
jgi:hypothetical protein